MSRRTPIALATLSLALGGCAIGPDYLRPANWLPDFFKEAPPVVATAEPSTVDARWWTLFNDATLNALVAQGLQHNADLRQAVARVEQAEALAREAGAALFPAIDAKGSISNNRPSQKTSSWSPNTPSVNHSRSAGLAISYEIDLWGRVRRANESVRASLLASRYARDSIRLSVAGLISSAYLNLRAVDAQLAVISGSLASREESARLVRTRVEAGLVSPLDQYQADGALAALKAQEADLRRTRALLAHQLALLTGQTDLQLPAGDLRQLPLPPLPPAGLPARLVEARPDVQAAEQQLIASNANIGVAKAAYYPNFSLTAGVGSESKVLSELFSGGASTWTAGIGLLMPILDWGRTSARVDQARALNQQSLVAWQNALQVAYKDVRDALVNLREYGEIEAARTTQTDNAEAAQKLARVRYDAGYSGYLEVLDAQRTANDAQLALIATRQARLNAAVDLFKALGGGWRPDAS